MAAERLKGGGAGMSDFPGNYMQSDGRTRRSDNQHEETKDYGQYSLNPPEEMDFGRNRNNDQDSFDSD